MKITNEMRDKLADQIVETLDLKDLLQLAYDDQRSYLSDISDEEFMETWDAYEMERKQNEL